MGEFLFNRIDDDKLEIVRRHVATHPVKVGALANALGLKVVRAPLPPKISGLIQPCKESASGYEIKVNKFEVPERQRFTVAHEIGHYLLHEPHIKSGIVDSIMYRSNLSSKKETEANKIAAEIIMPRIELETALDRMGGLTSDDDVSQLAHDFRVSLPAMKIRLGAQ
ncbi:ImmA/IrrE family metallo-endopeptidase [Euryhalocaulis caribicus]|uniref:ImmA/IrrE family metallo-endopeptidase n=1 Tax=Euryhalocaulis caribicus TaxID=1161401 RepID=UPI0009DC2FEA|nr:ImmA/IrrE family metallo-endopeptidase [Euryhalocaulis caribicus]